MSKKDISVKKELPEPVKNRLQILIQAQNMAHLNLENYVNGVIDSLSLEGQWQINIRTMTLEPTKDEFEKDEKAVEDVIQQIKTQEQ